MKDHGPFEAPSNVHQDALNETVIGTLDGTPLRARFPLHVHLFGVPAVVIPAELYAKLSAGAAGNAVPSPRARKSKSPIDNDPEVAKFLAANRSVLFTHEAKAECERRFGPGRTPSTSSIDRFWRRIEGRPSS